MKVGILSMQRVHNYGSSLQAFALKKTIEALGNECEFLDIRPGIQLPCHKSAKNIRKKNTIIGLLKKIDKYTLRRIRNFFFGKQFYKKYDSDYIKILKMAEEQCHDKKFDVVVIGSDEVFNCLQKSSWGFSEQLFGKGINANSIITYAASFGFTRMEDLFNNNLVDPIRSALTNVSEVSVRDQNSYHIVNELTGIPPVKHIDPALFYDFSTLMPDEIDYTNFILIYAYGNRITDAGEIRAIQNFAKKYNKKVIAAGMCQLFTDENILASPFELLRFVKNADYVITDTFHGTVFSIKYNKTFCTFIRNSNNEKIQDLLDTFRLSDRCIKDARDLERVLNTPFNGKLINDNIEWEKKRTIEYLGKHLG